MKKLGKRILKLPKLPRKWKVVRNLLAAALLMFAALVLMEWPSLTFRMAYRQLERNLLLSPSKVVYTHETADEAVFLTEGEGWVTAGNVTKVSVGNTGWKNNLAYIHYMIPKDGPCVLPMSCPTEGNELVIAVYGMPESTHSAGMELDLFDVPPPWYGNFLPIQDETLIAHSEVGENGWVIFTFAPHDHGDERLCALSAIWRNAIGLWDTIDGYSYRLKFYNQQGKLLDSLSAVLPESEVLFSQ